MADTSFVVEKAKTARAGCKECKQKIDKDVLRIGKVTTSPFSDDGKMTVFFHAPCMFESMKRARAATKKIEDTSDLEGFGDLDAADRASIVKMVDTFAQWLETRPTKTAKRKAPAGDGSPRKAPAPARARAPPAGVAATAVAVVEAVEEDGVTTEFSFAPAGAASSDAGPAIAVGASTAAGAAGATQGRPGYDLSTSPGLGPDISFLAFTQLCDRLAAEPSHTGKTKLVHDFITTGTDGIAFTGDTYLVLQLLLPLHPKRVYNMKSKQIAKIFSALFRADQDAMTEDLEQGDCPETCKKFFVANSAVSPAAASTITMIEAEEFLRRLEGLTKIEDQQREFAVFLPRLTGDDLKYIMRLVCHDLRIYAGPKHVLSGLDENAYPAFQASNNLLDVVRRTQACRGPGGLTKRLSVRASILTPVKPMLAEACRSLASAFVKCPRGLYCEIKYDGERVQLHKSGDVFHFYSRNLKPVTEHKISSFREFVPQACPHGASLILDSEVLMVDVTTGKPLPFGTLGIHKKKAFSDAVPCLFVFDILQINDENLMTRPLSERRAILEKNLTEIPNRIMLSQSRLMTEEAELRAAMHSAMRESLEGLVLKNVDSVYEPGKRHWLKVKRDYLEQGSMADSADLVVVGAYFGTGSKGGIMSTFLMACRDPAGRWRTVCKAGSGHDDATLGKINQELASTKISRDPSKVPSWLLINNNNLVPDFIVPDPKAAPVWEITGAEFSKSTSHSADGISIRFPRVTRIRDDKDWESATTLDELKKLAATSRQASDVNGGGDGDEEEEEEDISFSFRPSAAGAAGAVAAAPAPAPKPVPAPIATAARAAAPPPPPPRPAAAAPAPHTTTPSSLAVPVATAPRTASPTASTARSPIKAARPAATRKPRAKRAKKSEEEWSSDDSDDDGEDLRDFIVEDEEDEDGSYYYASTDEEDGPRKCRYGASCYQRNPQHRIDFWHPTDRPAPRPGHSSRPQTSSHHAAPATAAPPAAAVPAALDAVLPSIFAGLTAWVASTLPDTAKREANRYLVAYDGDIADSPAANVTHVLVDSWDVEKWDSDTKRVMQLAPGARVVSPAWIRACVATKSRVPETDHQP